MITNTQSTEILAFLIALLIAVVGKMSFIKKRNSAFTNHHRVYQNYHQNQSYRSPKLVNIFPEMRHFVFIKSFFLIGIHSMQG